MTGDKTMQHHATAMSGPEFLAAEAAQHAAAGKGDQAEAFKIRSAQWAQDRAALQHVREENDALNTRIAEAQCVMRGV